MDSVALYRKYRPHTWGDVLGQEHVISVLAAAVTEGNISHAYLFAGSRGTGKTSVARILAREIGTSERDLYEIDAASNRGIDEIRALRDAVFTLPFDSKRKVYIIDEAHMLTKEAWNALLKTLEEPPKHVMFIFATTEIAKVPDTIVSRCLSFTFKKPTAKILSDMLLAVAKKEGASLDRPSAELLALLADGSYRDAHGMLEKAIAASGKKPVTRELIERVAGAPKGTLVNSVLSAVAEKRSAPALAAISTAVSDNVDVMVFVRLLLEKTRVVLLLMHAPDMRRELQEEYSAEDFTLLESLAKSGGITSRTLMDMLQAAESVPRAPIPSLPLELAVVRICGETA